MIVALFRTTIVVAIVLVEGLVLVEDSAVLGGLPLEELVVDGAFLPRHILLLAVQWQS